jgi:hypothetical protein
MSTVYAVGCAECAACGHWWRAITFEDPGVPMLAGHQCPQCRGMRGRWATKPKRATQLADARAIARSLERPDPEGR